MKGAQVSMFRVGQHVSFHLNKLMKAEGDIVKLHKSGSQGVAEIRYAGHKISRRLQHVEAINRVA